MALNTRVASLAFFRSIFNNMVLFQVRRAEKFHLVFGPLLASSEFGWL